MRRRTTAAMGALVALAGALALVAPSPVSAQTGYPPGPCNVLAGFQELGDVRVGQRFTFQLAPQCVWTPGATINITVNGASFTKTANANGFVDVTVNVLSQTQAEVNPTVPVRCGINTIVGVGPSRVAGDRQVTQTATFNLICDAAPAKPATPVTGRLSLTGSNVLPWAAAALALLMVGALLTVASRRRASARS